MDNNAHNVTFVPKTTTREERDYERSDRDILLDLDFVSAEDLTKRKFQYSYAYGGARYGFPPNAFWEAIQTYDNVIAIVRSTGLIRRICSDFNFINTVPMFIYTDRTELTSRLKRKHFSDEQIAFRIARSEIALRDYYAHPEFYQEVIINNSSHDVFHTTIDRIIGKYASMPRIDPYNISVMMSYNPNNRKLDDYYDAIEAAVKRVSTSLRCSRLDKTPGSPKIANEFRAIASGARFVIVDLTENKHNVYYELGYLHAIGKTCIITAEEGTVPTLYPSEYKILFYGSARELRDTLRRELAKLLAISQSN